MITPIIVFIVIFIASEVITSPIYMLVRRRFSHRYKNPVFNIEASKGLLERFVLLLGLILNFPQVLIVFGALKIANRLQPESSDDKAKNYFLIGNLLSLLFVFLNYAIINFCLLALEKG